MKPCLGLAFLLYLAAPCVATCGTPFADGDRVLFLGDSITREGSWHALVSLFYHTRYPQKKIVWLNAGISGDTATGALRRLEWDVIARKPNRVVVMLGMNDIARDDLPGAVGSEQRIAQYRHDIALLTESLIKSGISVILCTPSPYDATARGKASANPSINVALEKCAVICRELAKTKQIPLVDFNTPLNQLNRDFQKTNPEFTVIGPDRIHPGVLGTTVMAYLFLQAQGVDGVVSEANISVSAPGSSCAVNAQIDGLHATAKEVRFTLRENALPLPMDSDVRKAAHLVPFTAQLNRQMLKIEGLDENEYELVIDDQPVGRFWSNELAGGLNLSLLRATPQYAQAKQVAAANSSRHKLSSAAPRMMAFTRALTLKPAGIDENDAEAVKAFLEKLIADPAAPARADLGSGGFAQTMARQYLANRPQEAATETAIANATAEIDRHRQSIPHRFLVRVANRAPATGQQESLFAARHGAEQQEKIAAEFLSLLILDQPTLQRSNLHWRAPLHKVADLNQTGDKVAALAVYRDYLFEKLRTPGVYGIPESLLAIAPGLLKPGAKQRVIARADAIMRGSLTNDGRIMPPGSVWLPRERGGMNGACILWTPELFQPLAEAYLLTGQQGYLGRWIEYLEDWAMFEQDTEDIAPTDISDNDSRSIRQVLIFYQLLAGVARLQSPAKTEFPADSLARILGKLIRVYPPLTLLYHDSNSQNWTPGATASMMQAAVLLDEFRVSEYLFTRARRRHESYGTLQFLPDGGETEHALWYNCHYFSGAVQTLELAEARSKVEAKKRLAWEGAFCKEEWTHDQNARLEERARFFLQMLTPQSQYPIGNRSDQRELPDWNSASMIERAVRNGARDIQELSATLSGSKSNILPEFTMSALPYTGSYIMRTGWGKRDSYAHFFCSPLPVGGHALPGLKANNSFFLSCEGQDLLVSGGFGGYSYDRSPLRVDGKEQFAHAGISNPGINKNHKGFGIAYPDPQPSFSRVHSSQYFDFAEGTYGGPYGDFVDDHHDNKDYRTDFLAECARKVVTGVTHQRQVLFIKQPRIWVVVDRLRSDAPHTYALDWRLPAAADKEMAKRPKFAGKAFAAPFVQIDQTAQTIVTSEPEAANVRIHQFGPQLAYTLARETGENIRNDYTNHYRMYDFWRVSGEWAGKGNEIVVSLIEAVPPGGVSAIKSLDKLPPESGKCGFHAIDADGKSIRFLADADGGLELSMPARGIVIGESSYEFFENIRTPIERPVSPVYIEPRRNCIGAKQEITLRCDTKGVELRYTLDGADPTRQSMKYDAPFYIKHAATIKARAFREGTLLAPTIPSGTHASPVATAHYQQPPLLEPVAAIADPGYQPGLSGEYYEGSWRNLVFFPERVKPLKHLQVKNLFDQCRPDAEKIFRWTYSGFLAVPSDGVYTFYAPQELVSSAQEQGYDLRVFAGRAPVEGADGAQDLNVWYPATSRHAFGTWSIALKQGMHPFHVWYVDYRADAAERLNHPGMRTNTIWDGSKPLIEVSGPGLERQEIPAQWFYTQKQAASRMDNGKKKEKP